MKTSRFVTRSLIVLTVVAIVALSAALSAGAVLAQGPGNGRGVGASGAGGNGAGGYGLTLQLQDPTVCLNCTAGTAAGTGLQYGAGNRYARMARRAAGWACTPSPRRAS